MRTEYDELGEMWVSYALDYFCDDDSGQRFIIIGIGNSPEESEADLEEKTQQLETHGETA